MSDAPVGGFCPWRGTTWRRARRARPMHDQQGGSHGTALLPLALSTTMSTPPEPAVQKRAGGFMARKVFEDSVVPLPPDDGLAPNGLVVQAAAPRNASETMEVMFSLALPAED